MERDATGPRKVDPYHLLFQGGQFYLARPLARARRAARLPPVAHPRQGRLRDEGRARLQAPGRLRPARVRQPRRVAVRRARSATAEVWVSERIAWQVERHFGRFGEVAPRRRRRRSSSRTPYADARQLASWVLASASTRTCVGPPELVEAVAERVALLASRHERQPDLAPVLTGAPAEANGDGEHGAEPTAAGRREAAIRPERFARLVTLASHPHRRRPRAASASPVGEVLRAPADLRAPSCARTSTCSTSSTSAAARTCSTPRSPTTATIEVDPEPYSDNFARPARLLPVEAKALVAAIDLIGDHLPEGALTSAREKIVAALGGTDPMSPAARRLGGRRRLRHRARRLARRSPSRRLLRLEYYKPNEDEFSERTVEPYALINGREGWYVASFDPAKDDVRHFRLDRIKHAEVTDDGVRAAPRGRPRRRRRRLAAHRRGRGLAHRARLGLARARALGARGAPRRRRSWPTARWSSSCPTRAPTGSCARVLEEAGDAAVLEPADAREAVRRAVARLR